MGGFMGIVAIVFGVFWTMTASSIGAPFWMFGIVFILIGIMSTGMNFKNAFGKNRYSSFDITGSGEEPDPLATRLGYEKTDGPESDSGSEYCPYCGNPVENTFEFCRKCGKRLP